MPMTSPSGSSPESLFAAWLEEDSAGAPRDFEAFCREHGDLAPALRELYGHWLKLEQVVRQFGVGKSLTDKLQSHFGKDVDPKVTLEAEEQAEAGSSSEILSRLGSRGPVSTRYRIQGEVAHGGMGAVLRVWDLDLRRHLAMKVMLGGGGLRDGQAEQLEWSLLSRFLEEAQVTGQLDHPGIVPVHELGLDAQGRIYFTMKLVRGQTLKTVFDELARGEGEWTQVRVLGLILKVCEAMSYAHAKGVIHRDLKPANVMVGKFGEVYVMDWGLAKILGRDDGADTHPRDDEPEQHTVIVRSERHDQLDQSLSPLFTMDGDVVGTPGYMPPEQALGQIAEMGPQSDVYAVGAMLYHLLAGQMPYVQRGARPNNNAIWNQVRAGPPQPLEDLAPQTPAELTAICSKAMQRDKAARYASTKELGEDLAAYVEGRVVRAYETGAWAEARKWIQRNKPLAGSLAAALLLAVGGLSSTSYVQAKGRTAERIQHERADEEAETAKQNLVLAQQREREAKDNLDLAQRNEAEAKSQQLRAEAETAKVLRLSDVKVHQELMETADRLWPPYPARIGDLETWLGRARGLVANLPQHRATLAEMRTRAHPWSGEERARDRASHPLLGELALEQAEQEALIAYVERGLPGAAREKAEARIAELESHVASLTEKVESRQTWSFDTAEDQWQHDVLAELVADLEVLQSDLDRRSGDHAWSMPKRLAFAQELETSFAAGGQAANAWSVALPALRSAYPGLDLHPQMGLVPIGPDPQSGLWEFAHLLTGVPAQRSSDGKLVLTEEMGIVLVLLPGGVFWMGAQASDPKARNYDPLADKDEPPVHEVELSAFFISKYEMTQGQWQRLTGRNPSIFNASNANLAILLPGNSAPTLLHPVDQVTWDECATWLPRADLDLPWEARWEYAARAGTDTPWWTGSDKETLVGAANLLDRYAHVHGDPNWLGYEEWLDDGAVLQVPIGTTRANGFGLHEMAGNMLEWCADGFDAGFYAHSPRLDPVCPWVGAASRVQRGGHYNWGAIVARSASRMMNIPSSGAQMFGLRAARSLDR